MYSLPTIPFYKVHFKLDFNYFFLDVSSEAGGSVSPVNKRRVFSG